MSTLVTLDELHQQLASSSPPRLLEALPLKYYLDAHLPGAVDFPHDQVWALAPVVVPDKGADIVVYCASATCQNSLVAARTLESLGYTRVRVFAGGKKEWVEAGMPVEKGVVAEKVA